MPDTAFEGWGNSLFVKPHRVLIYMGSFVFHIT